MGVGRWDRGTLPPWILKFDIFLLHFKHEKLVFLVLRRKKMEFHDFRLPVERSLWLLLEKSANGLVKIRPTPMFLITVDFSADSSRSSWNDFRFNAG